MVIVKSLREPAINAIVACMSEEIKKGKVKLYGRKRPTSAEFLMEDPAKFVGGLANTNPTYTRSLLELSKKIHRLTQPNSVDL